MDQLRDSIPHRRSFAEGMRVASREERQRAALQSLLDEAGVALNGSAPCDIVVHDDRFYSRVLAGGSLALGESYVDGWWDCEALDQLFERILSAHLEERVKSWRILPLLIRFKLFNPARRSRAFEIGRRHYDRGNDLFEAMLDRRMTYSCAYWKDARTLDEAQEAKLDLCCRKLRLEHGMRVLDIGCGWGSFAAFAAERYGVRVVGITVSKEQVELARQRTAGLPVEIRLQDYRELDERFDAIVSIGMFEHVGVKNYGRFFEVARRCLRKDGLFLLHTIGANFATTPDPWIEKYIFPNGMIPTVTQISAAVEKLFVIEDWHNFGVDYDPTLMAWFSNFDRGWERLKKRYDERFYRLWKYYLLCCAGSFRARHNNVWQIVLSKEGMRGGYRPAR